MKMELCEWKWWRWSWIKAKVYEK